MKSSFAHSGGHPFETFAVVNFAKDGNRYRWAEFRSRNEAEMFLGQKREAVKSGRLVFSSIKRVKIVTIKHKAREPK